MVEALYLLKYLNNLLTFTEIAVVPLCAVVHCGGGLWWRVKA